jgi:hypothetical protein
LHALHLAFVHQTRKLFELLGGDRFGEKGDGVRFAGFVGREHLERIADEVEFAGRHLMHIEDVRVLVGAVGEEELGDDAQADIRDLGAIDIAPNALFIAVVREYLVALCVQLERRRDMGEGQ